MAEMFLKIDGIQGETLDTYRPGEIEIQTWTWDAGLNPVRWDLNQGGQSTRANTDKIVVTKVCDQASVALYQYCVTGKHFKNARIICRKNDGEEKINYLTIEMEDVMIQEVNWSGQGESPTLTETIELAFADFTVRYKKQRDSGAADGDVHFGFNIQTQVQK